MQVPQLAMMGVQEAREMSVKLSRCAAVGGKRRRRWEGVRRGVSLQVLQLAMAGVQEVRGASIKLLR